MGKSFVTSVILGGLMLLSGILASVMTPAVASLEARRQIELETLIPREFAGWRQDSSMAGFIVNPEMRGTIDRIYSQTLSRTYINEAGERIMLSVAYGGVQKTNMHAHRPELCYEVGGFEVGEMNRTFIDTAIGRIPVMQMVAKQGVRIEPVTYWIRVGDSLTRGWLEQNLTAIWYTLIGKVPDGLLVRVSSISGEVQHSYRIQQTFLSSMLQSVRREDRVWLVGKLK